MAELLELAIRQRLADVHVALPGRVESYNAAEQKADIKPMLKRPIRFADGTYSTEELPVIPNVPIIFPRSSAFYVTFPIAKGDLVQLVFNERSIDQYKSKQTAKTQREATDPIEIHSHQLTDAVAFPGFYPFGLPIADIDDTNMALGRDSGARMVLTTGDEIHFRKGASVDDAVAVANVLISWLSTHTHSTGVGPSGFPIQTVDPDIASDFAKIKKNPS